LMTSDKLSALYPNRMGMLHRNAACDVGVKGGHGVNAPGMSPVPLIPVDVIAVPPAAAQAHHLATKLWSHTMPGLT
jgi:hypothetical protein